METEQKILRYTLLRAKNTNGLGFQLPVSPLVFLIVLFTFKILSLWKTY